MITPNLGYLGQPLNLLAILKKRKKCYIINGQTVPLSRHGVARLIQEMARAWPANLRGA
jgi:hypothetical protein